MVRQKGQPTKKEERPNSSNTNSSASTNLTSTSTDLPKIFEHEFRRAQHRFLFNVDQIEQKYKNSTSGLVFKLNRDTDKEEIEFDPELCTAENDVQLMEMINRQKKCVKGPIGDALISTPAPDPEQRNKKGIAQWKKLNKDFDAKYTKIMKEQDSNKKLEMKQKDDEKENAEQQQRRCTALVKYEGKAADPPKNIQLDVILRTSTETYKFCGGLDAISALFNNQQKFIKLPPTIKHKMLAIEGKKEEENEEEQCENLAKRRKVNSLSLDNGPSTSYGKDYSPSKERSTRFSLFEPVEGLEPIITIPETPLSKMGNWDWDGKSFRMTINDEIVEQTPPEEFRQTPCNSQFSQKIQMATPSNKIDEGMPIVQTPSTIQNLGMIQSIASRTRAKAIKECERKQHAMASEMIGTAISRIQGIVHENGKLVGQPDMKNTLKRLNSDLQGIIKNSFGEQMEKQFKAAQQNQHNQGTWLQRKRTKANREFMVNEDEEEEE